MGGGGGSKGPDKNYQRQQQAELDRLTREENKRLRAMQRGRLGRASLLSGLDLPVAASVPGSASVGGIRGSANRGGGGGAGNAVTGSGGGGGGGTSGSGMAN